MKNWLKITLLSITTAILGSVGFAGVILSMTTPPVETAVVAPVIVKDRPLLDMVNELRVKQGVSPLTASPELNQSAQEKANDMVAQHYFGHANPQGVHGIVIIPKYLPSATLGSENLTVCVSGDNNIGAFKAWSDSPAHYQGMIDPRVTLYGEGKAYDTEKGCTIYVNHFAAV